MTRAELVRHAHSAAAQHSRQRRAAKTLHGPALDVSVDCPIEVRRGKADRVLDRSLARLGPRVPALLRQTPAGRWGSWLLPCSVRLECPAGLWRAQSRSISNRSRPYMSPAGRARCRSGSASAWIAPRRADAHLQDALPHWKSSSRSARPSSRASRDAFRGPEVVPEIAFQRWGTHRPPARRPPVLRRRSATPIRITSSQNRRSS